MKTGFFTKKRIIAGAIIIVAVLLCAGGVYSVQLWDKMNHNQMDLFNQTVAPLPTDAETSPPAETATGAQSADPNGTPAPSATISPEDALKAQADSSILKDTLNVLLIGTDFADERVDNDQGKYKGKYFNSDVMIVLAINFKQNKVDMISIPRDSYAMVNNMDGIYKLNFSMSAGGGMNDKGYMNVCKSVQYMLDDKGQIPVNYYIAGSIPSVKELTDMVGGVDFNVAMNFRIDGRAYKKGMQHLTGQGVLDYCRVRKDSGTGYIDGPSGDQYRVQRQRAVLMKVFEKLKDNASWLNVPTYLMKMQGKVSTNLNISQLAAITLWAKDLPMENIKDHSMPGNYNYGIFGLNYELIDQTGRIKLIKDIYGMTVDKEYKYDPNYAKLLWAYMQGDAWIKSTKETLQKDANLKDKRKFIDTVQLAQVNDLIKQVQRKMAGYKSKLYNSSKPNVSAGEVNDLTTQVELLHNPDYSHSKPATYTVVDEMFFNAGYKVNWNSHIYVPEALKMLE